MDIPSPTVFHPHDPQLQDDSLAEALTRRTAGGGVIGSFDKELTVKQADAARDSLCMSLYQLAFDWCVSLLNDKTAAPKEAMNGTIRILDVFGFENAAVNGFPQARTNSVSTAGILPPLTHATAIHFQPLVTDNPTHPTNNSPPHTHHPTNRRSPTCPPPTHPPPTTTTLAAHDTTTHHTKPHTTHLTPPHTKTHTTHQKPRTTHTPLCIWVGSPACLQLGGIARFS